MISSATMPQMRALLRRSLLQIKSFHGNNFKIEWGLFKDISTSAYATYAIRGSDPDPLEYERFTAGVDCTYSYEF